jgi:alpha-beta hydrolase superfamily lysophospholipase
MRFIGKIISRFLLLLILAGGMLYIFGPYEDSDLTASFDESMLDGGIETYLEQAEARFDDITPGVEKQIVWVDKAETQAPWSVLYIHGFSATAQEIRPVPDQVAEALGANLIFTRLTGHGRGGDAMAEGSVSAWVHDVAEALAIARRTGERVLVISTSTGGTLAAAAALDPVQMEQVAGIVMISPNFGINNPAAPILTWPAARYWAPVIAGAERSFEPRNEGQARYWTTRYPSVAALPMAALVKEVMAADLSQARVPALFIYSQDDKVVVPAATAEVIGRWRLPTETIHPTPGPEDDPFNHVIAGDIMSPGQTAVTVDHIVTWAEGL